MSKWSNYFPEFLEKILIVFKMLALKNKDVSHGKLKLRISNRAFETQHFLAAVWKFKNFNNFLAICGTVDKIQENLLVQWTIFDIIMIT